MKLGAFVLGGLAGAAVAVMVSRNRRMSAIASGVGSMLSHRMSGMKEMAIDKALNMKFGTRASGFAKKHEADHDSGAMEQVARLAAKDPHVQKEIDDILEEGGHHRI